MAFVDYYKILGIPKDTPQDQISVAYKKRVKQVHPDLHPEDPKATAKFQAVQEANSVLSDPEKRKKYDRYGQYWKEADAMNRGGWGNDARAYGNAGEDVFGGFDGTGGFSDFFYSFFGRHGGMGGHRRGANDYRGGGCSGHCHQGEESVCTHVGIDLYTALLGGSVILATDHGKVRLRLKPCTRPGTKLRIKGKGPADASGQPSDLIVVFDVEWPDSLTERQRQLVMEMRNASGR